MKRLTLREARDQHDPPLTQEQLEDKSQVDQTTISGIESGRIKNPSSHTVELLENALRIPRGTLKFERAAERQSSLPLRRKVS